MPACHHSSAAVPAGAVAAAAAIVLLTVALMGYLSKTSLTGSGSRSRENLLACGLSSGSFSNRPLRFFLLPAIDQSACVDRSLSTDPLDFIHSINC